MRGINKAIIVGTLGADPETKYTQTGSAITNISVATSEEWTDKTTNQKQKKTEWHRIDFFGKTAEIAAQYLSKGSKVYVEGSITTNKWKDQSGNDRYSTSIKGRELQMLGSKQDAVNQQAQQQPQPNTQPQEQAPMDGFDDDIPF